MRAIEGEGRVARGPPVQAQVAGPLRWTRACTARALRPRRSSPRRPVRHQSWGGLTLQLRPGTVRLDELPASVRRPTEGAPSLTAAWSPVRARTLPCAAASGSIWTPTRTRPPSVPHGARRRRRERHRRALAGTDAGDREPRAGPCAVAVTAAGWVRPPSARFAPAAEPSDIAASGTVTSACNTRPRALAVGARQGGCLNLVRPLWGPPARVTVRGRGTRFCSGVNRPAGRFRGPAPESVALGGGRRSRARELAGAPGAVSPRRTRRWRSSSTGRDSRRTGRVRGSARCSRDSARRSRRFRPVSRSRCRR